MGASVTNLREWRKERDTPRAELLESRDNSPRRVGESRPSGMLGLLGRRIEWFVEPPQVRTVVIDDDVVRLAFPHMLFGVQRRRDGRFVSLHVFALAGNDVTPDNIGDTLLWLLPLPNIIGQSAWVCFGEFNSEIVSGAVDPIEAFWSSQFSHHLAAVWKRPAMDEWARLTKRELRGLRVDADASAREASYYMLSIRAMQTSMRPAATTPSSVLARYILEQWLPSILTGMLAFIMCTFIYSFIHSFSVYLAQ